MKTPDQIGKRIAELMKDKSKIIDSRILAEDSEMIDFYNAEIIRYNFMINELQWVLKP